MLFLETGTPKNIERQIFLAYFHVKVPKSIRYLDKAVTIQIDWKSANTQISSDMSVAGLWKKQYRKYICSSIKKKIVKPMIMLYDITISYFLQQKIFIKCCKSFL